MKVKELIEWLEDLDPDMEVVFTDRNQNKNLIHRGQYDITIEEYKCYDGELLVDYKDPDKDFEKWAIENNYTHEVQEYRGYYGSAVAIESYVEIDEGVYEDFKEGLKDIALVELHKK